MARRLAACLLVTWLAAATPVAQNENAASGPEDKPDFDVLYVATPEKVVNRMVVLTGPRSDRAIM